MNLIEAGAWALVAAFVVIVIVRTVMCALLGRDEPDLYADPTPLCLPCADGRCSTHRFADRD